MASTTRRGAAAGTAGAAEVSVRARVVAGVLVTGSLLVLTRRRSGLVRTLLATVELPAIEVVATALSRIGL
jgi:hypothetical protein